LYDYNTGDLIHSFLGHADTVLSLVMDDECKSILSGSRDRTIKWWHIPTYKEIRTIKAHNGYVNTIDLCNNTIVSGSSDSTIKVWDLETGTLIRTMGGHTRDVKSLKFDSSCTKVISGSEDKTAKVWNITRGTYKTLYLDNDYIYSVTMSRDGNIGITASGNNNIHMWDLHNYSIIKNFTTIRTIYSLALTSNNLKLVAGDYSGYIKIWNTDSG